MIVHTEFKFVTLLYYFFFMSIDKSVQNGNIYLSVFSEEFERVRGDKEQLEAAKMLLKYPIVVISGKGGCGKTTVVTKVMSLQK